MINTKPKGKAILTQEQFKNLTTPVPNREYHIVIKEGGTTAERPTSPDLYQMYYDTTLSALMIWNGTVWVQQSNIALTKAQVEAVLTGVITTHTHDPAQVNTNASNRFVTDIEKITWNNKQDKLVAGDNITIVDNIISASGGGVDLNEMDYFNYAGSIYGAKYSLLASAWEHSLIVDPLEISEDSDWQNPRGKAQYPNGEFEGVIIPQGVTGIGDDAFSDWTSNNQPLVIPNSVTSIGNYSFYEWTSNNQPLVIPDGVTSIGDFAFNGWSSNNQPLVIPGSVTSIGANAFYDWTSNNQPLVIPDSIVSIGTNVFYNWTSNNQLLVIPNSVTSIGDNAFRNWTSNNQPLIISNSVTSIGNNAFQSWVSNNQPLVIPNSVTSIGNISFGRWVANKHPLIIPNSVTSIGSSAFNQWSLVPYVEMKSSTPPTLANANAFGNQNDAPIYVPDESVDDYKTATNWADLADRIFPISDKDKMIEAYSKTQIDAMIGDIESLLGGI